MQFRHYLTDNKLDCWAAEFQSLGLSHEWIMITTVNTM